MAEILEKDIDSLDNISVYYDKDWNQCDKEEKMYWLEVTQAQNQAQEDDLKKVKLRCILERILKEKVRKRRNLSFEPEYLYTVKERDIMDKYIPESTTHDLKVMGL